MSRIHSSQYISEVTKPLVQTLQNQDVAIYENGAFRVVGKVKGVGLDHAIQAAMIDLEVDPRTQKRLQRNELTALPIGTYVLVQNGTEVVPTPFTSTQLLAVGVLGMALGYLLK